MKNKAKALLEKMEKEANAFNSDDKAEVRAIILAVLGIVIAAILIAALLPSTVQNLINSRNASWGNGALLPSTYAGGLAIYDAIPIFAFLAALLIFVAIVVKLLD